MLQEIKISVILLKNSMPAKIQGSHKNTLYFPFPYNHVPFLYPLFFSAPASGIPLSYTIDAFKGFTLPFCLLVSYYFKQFNNSTMMVYTAIHGLYGLLWLAKSFMYPDLKWTAPSPLYFHFITAAVLGGYWLGPYSIASSSYEAPAWRLGLAVFMFGLGVFFHFVSDLHKFVSLKLAPGKLITSMLWGISRNPNYFGELLIYTSFLVISLDYRPILAFTVSFVFYWIPNMYNYLLI